MLLLTENNAVDYLHQTGWPGAQQAQIRSLGGGVSNTVLLAEGPESRIVCKQALEKLRVEADWRSRPDRTLREAEALQTVAPLLPAGAVPRVHYLDRANYIYTMEAAPASAHDWKSELMVGEADPTVAYAAGRILGGMIRATWQSSEWEAKFGDQTVFDELRLDPYYRYTASRHPDCAAHFDALIESCRTRRVALVHGDWSPKNLLLGPKGVMAIDFEVVHYGDPCFDTGFLLNHLVLKAIHFPFMRDMLHACAHAFWTALALDTPWAFSGTMAHLGGLLLARVDGKSPAEYLTPDEKVTARALAKKIIATPPGSIRELWQCL